MQAYPTYNLLALLLSLVFGSAISVFFDVFRVLRRIFRHPPWLVFLEDFLFCIVCAFSFVVFTFGMNYGTYRLTYFIGTCVGFLLFFNSFSRVFMAICEKLICLIKSLFYSVWKLVRKPFIRFFKLVKRLISALFKAIYARISPFFRKMGKALRPKRKSKSKRMEQIL